MSPSFSTSGRKMKKHTSAIFSSLLFLLALTSLALFPGCSGSEKGGTSQKTKRVIIVTNGDDPFWDAMREGMEKAQEDFKLGDANLQVALDKNDGTPEGQVDKLRQYLSQTDIAAVGISVIDPNNAAMADAMRELQKQGVVVVTIDSDVNRDKFKDTRFGYLGTKNTFGGRQMGLAAKKLRPDGGKYATFYGIEGVSNVIERNDGFAEGAGDSFEKKAGMADGMKAEVAADNVRNSLENHSDIDTLVGIWAYDAHAIVTVVKEREIRDKMTVVVFDAAPKAIQHLKDGFIDAMVVQDPYGMGYEGVKLMKGLYEEDEKAVLSLFPDYDFSKKSFTSDDGDIHHTNVRVVVPNDSTLTKDDFDSEIKFFTIDEFNKWLKERGLVGS